MRASHTRLFVHLVWATWDRQPLITAAMRPRLMAALAEKCGELRCPALAIGIVADHVHVLAELHPTMAVASLVGEIKGSSSHLFTHAVAPERIFKWQGSYGAFSVDPMSVAAVREYVLGQERHHTEGALRPEWEDVPRLPTSAPDGS